MKKEPAVSFLADAAWRRGLLLQALPLSGGLCSLPAPGPQVGQEAARMRSSEAQAGRWAWRLAAARLSQL